MSKGNARGMQDDAISRQAAIEVIVDAVKALPSAEPKKGKWINIVESIEYACGTCDTCGTRIPMVYKYYEYCPHCGMKNEVEHDGNMV